MRPAGQPRERDPLIVRHVRLARNPQIGERIEQALRAHGLALHEWSLRALGKLRADFSAQAEIIRSQIGDGREASADDATVLRADLAALGEDVPV